jgi:hypothetical protein
VQISKKETRVISFVQIFIVLHCIEEYLFGFPAWATIHFGTTTQTWYLLSHFILLFPFVAILTGTYRGARWGIFLAVMMQTIIFTNGIFHLSTMLVWNEYSPGSITQLLIIPMTMIVFRSVIRNNLLPIRTIARSILLGTTLSGLVLLSLLLNIPI